MPGISAPGSGGSVGQGLSGAWAERRAVWGEEEGGMPPHLTGMAGSWAVF